jgi:hypothetical protein
VARCINPGRGKNGGVKPATPATDPPYQTAINTASASSSRRRPSTAHWQEARRGSRRTRPGPSPCRGATSEAGVELEHRPRHIPGRPRQTGVAFPSRAPSRVRRGDIGRAVDGARLVGGDAVIIDRRRAPLGDGAAEGDLNEDRIGSNLRIDALRPRGGTPLISTRDDCMNRAALDMSPPCWLEHRWLEHRRLEYLHTETTTEEAGAGTSADSTPGGRSAGIHIHLFRANFSSAVGGRPTPQRVETSRSTCMRDPRGHDSAVATSRSGSS